MRPGPLFRIVPARSKERSFPHYGDEFVSTVNSFRTGPDEGGHFGIFGGRYVAETLMPLILELERVYNVCKADPGFQKRSEEHTSELQSH